MRLIGRKKLQRLMHLDNGAREWVRAWVAEVSYANWREPADINWQFPNARKSDAGQFIFPIANSDEEVYLEIAFKQSIAIITDLK